MMRMAKVRITRPGGNPPLEAAKLTRGGSVGRSGLEYQPQSQKREAAEHDRAIRDYDPATVEAAWNDLNAREVWNKKDPEHRWVMARRAALRRLGISMRERGLA